MTLSRRHVLKRALTTGVYVTPVVLSVTTVIEPAAAVTPPGIIGGTMPASVTFLSQRVQYTGQGAGFPPNQVFLFLLAGPDGSVLSQSVIRTDATGATTITVDPGSFTIGGRTAPAMINGPYVFVFLADTGGTNIDATGTAAALPTPINPYDPQVAPISMQRELRPLVQH